MLETNGRQAYDTARAARTIIRVYGSRDVNYDLLTRYREIRRQGNTARIALQFARYQIGYAETFERFEKLGGEVVSPDAGNEPGSVRLVVGWDDFMTLEDMEGDMFSPDVNSDIDPEQLARERKEYAETLDRDGVVFLSGQYYDGRTWQTVDSIGGIEGASVNGPDPARWDVSDYAADLIGAAIEAYQEAHAPVSRADVLREVDAAVHTFRASLEDILGAIPATREGEPC